MAGTFDESLANTVIGGQFTLREIIGSGGMGKVFRAEQKGVGRSVAVKIMHRHLLGDRTAASRFTNEARAASSLNHPNSIAVLDFGQTEGGVLYIVMEYLRGRSLDSELRQSFPMPLGRVAHIFCQALDAVDAAHAQKIIHRDLKPENVFLLENRSNIDFVKVLDFGIAKLLDMEGRAVTTPGLVPGTPEYMSPEQARGEKLDPRSDVYSLGVILYEMLTATVPFKGSSAIATMMSHVQDPVEPPSRRRPDLEIPPAVDAVVTWALAKDPAERISSARQFRDVVSAWAQVAGVWPTEMDPTASSPDVLRDFFSAEELDHMTEEVSTEHRAGAALAPGRAGPVAHRSDVLVGREPERECMRAFVEAAADGPRALRISGGIGVGRSRLADELQILAHEGDYRVIRCKPDRGWVRPLLGASRRAISALLEVDTTDPGAETVLAAAERLGLQSDDISALQDLFNHPSEIAHIEPRARAREWTTAFRALISAAGKRGRVLCLVEDWDLLDTSSRALFRRLLADSPAGTALVVTHAADSKERWPEGEGAAQVLQIEPLGPSHAHELASQMFGGVFDPAAADDLGRASGGQPLFIEQLAFSVAYEGMADPPDKLADLLAWRVERLRKEERYALQWFAVLDDVATAESFNRLSGLEIATSQLDALAERGFLVSVPEGFDYAHPFISMVVYSSIPLEARREMHQSVAEYLRAEGSAIGAVAHHAYQADDGQRAIEELTQAGMWSQSRLDPSGAILWYTRALELVRREWGRGRVPAEGLDEMAVDLALRLATVLRQTNQAPMAEGILEEVLSVAAGNDMARARLRLKLGRIDMERGNVQRAVRHLQLAQADAQAAASDWLSGEITRELARARALMGEREVAGQLLVESLRISTHADEDGARDRWETSLASAATCLDIGFPEHAGEHLSQALENARATQANLGRLKILIRMAELHLSRAEWDDAEQRIRQAIDLAQIVGDRTRRAELLIQMGRVRRIKGNVSEGRRYLQQAVDLSREIGWEEGVRLAQEESDILGLLGGKDAT